MAVTEVKDTMHFMFNFRYFASCGRQTHSEVIGTDIVKRETILTEWIIVKCLLRKRRRQSNSKSSRRYQDWVSRGAVFFARTIFSYEHEI